MGTLADGSRALADLRLEAGTPAHSTMRDHLRALGEAGLVEKHRSADFPGSVGYELTAAGRGLLRVAPFLAAWLAAAPDSPVDLGTNAAKNATRALADGWASGMVHALAAGPLSLTELDCAIPSLSYPSLERRLTAMRQLGLLEVSPGEGRSRPYRATDWLRQGIVPLSAATCWEQRCLGSQAPQVMRHDIETIFLLGLPLPRMDEGVSGSYRVAVHWEDGRADGMVGAVAEVDHGTVTSCAAGLEGSHDAWVLGSIAAWFSASSAGDSSRLELAGDRRLATALVEGLHGALRGLVER